MKNRIPGFFLRAIGLPHTLIGGMTGAGKSVLMDGLLYALIHRDPKSAAKVVLIDPKGVSFRSWKLFPHCVAYADTPERAALYLERSAKIMDDRYRRLARLTEKRAAFEWQPQMSAEPDVYIFIDEWADLALSAQSRGIREAAQKILQKGRAARVHVILATQNATFKIIPTVLRDNFPVRIALRCADSKASHVILGIGGAENISIGECLYMDPSVWPPMKLNVPMYETKKFLAALQTWRKTKTKKWKLLRG